MKFLVPLAVGMAWTAHAHGAIRTETIDYADGLFVEADADMDEPHYHFVQTFKVS